MYKSCAYCGRIHQRGFICPHKPKRKRKTYEANEIIKFRNTKAWRYKANDVRTRDLQLCRVCLSENKYTFESLSVHHIVPLEEDFEQRLDDDNLITLCSAHHSEADRGGISRNLLLSLAKVPPYPETGDF